jgi:isopentenyl-diphosphate delta-isomerase
MGVDCELEPLGAFTYRAELADGLVEHEVDHVFVGRAEGDPDPDPSEVEAWRWVRPADLRREMRRAPERFTPWLAGALRKLEHRLRSSVAGRPSP